MENGLSQIQQGELLSDVKYLKSCCADAFKKFDQIEEINDKRLKEITDEQLAAKNRTIATLVGVVVTFAFIVLTYFRK